MTRLFAIFGMLLAMSSPGATNSVGQTHSLLAYLALPSEEPAPSAAPRAPVATTAATNVVRQAEYTWDELATLAGKRADKAMIARMRAMLKRQSVESSLAWKDPQLRLGRTWEDSRDRAVGDPPANGDGDTFTATLRFYISNPFVNRYLRLAGEADVAALEQRATAEAYAVYCEVRSLCLEDERLRREQRIRAEMGTLWNEVRKSQEERIERGMEKSPVDAIKAEIAGEQEAIRASELALARRQVRRQLSFYTGLPERELKIRYTPPEPPTTNRAYAAMLTDVAFSRRPDLVGALKELESARASVGAAKAAHLPWFDFVEGTYAHSTDSGTDWSGSGAKRFRGHKTGRDDDWQVRLAINLPIFTWFGDSVKMSRMVEELADARVNALNAAIENEISSAFEEFLAADERFVRLSDRSARFVRRMEARLGEFGNSPAVRPDDVCRGRIELLEYRRLKERSEFAWIASVLMLETVSGGPLPH